MSKKNILITGGAGFIGSHVVRLFVNRYPDFNIICYDKLTYAGNLENLKDVENADNYIFVNGDITDVEQVKETFDKYDITDVIHLAAESHVDRSIRDPFIFTKTNVNGTLNLLHAAKNKWEDHSFFGNRFYHISTDEVYGALDNNPENKFTEETKYNPHSPYSASKASSDHFVRAFHDTYGMPTLISNCSNNYGPNQFPEKLIPLIINNLKNNKKIPVYGTGENIRDWLYVEDHAKAIATIFLNGKIGETYNIGGNNEIKNIDIVKTVVNVYDKICAERASDGVELKNRSLDNIVEYVKDRKGHDLRYAIDSTKLQTQLHWKPEETFETGIYKTVKWYLDNEEWLNNVTSGDYKEYYKKYYGNK